MVDFNEVILFCFYYGADVYVMSKKKKLFVHKFLQCYRYHWVYYM